MSESLSQKMEIDKNKKGRWSLISIKDNLLCQKALWKGLKMLAFTYDDENLLLIHFPGVLEKIPFLRMS